MTELTSSNQPDTQVAYRNVRKLRSPSQNTQLNPPAQLGEGDLPWDQVLWKHERQVSGRAS